MAKNQQKTKSKYKIKKFFKKNMMLFIVLGIILVLGSIAMIASLAGQSNTSSNIYGDDVITMHYFHLRTCSHCQRMNEYLPDLQAQYPNLKIEKYEMTEQSSAEKYREMAQEYEELDSENFPGTPLTIVGDEFETGFGTAESSGPIIEEMVEKEQQKIEENWDEETMTRTVELRQQEQQSQNE